jgi:hypothetical protein
MYIFPMLQINCWHIGYALEGGHIGCALDGQKIGCP